MNMHHDLPEEADPVDDLSTLAWVHDELRRSLEAAHKSLRRYLKETAARSGSDVDAVDPSVLRAARAHLHQSVGALELIGLHGTARVLRASESAVQRFIVKPRPMTPAAVETIESASFGVLDCLSRKLAGKGLPTLALFPQYRALLELAGADRVHPADLWRDDWQWHELPAEAGVAPLAADVAARSAMETLVLAIMRANDRGAMARLSDLCAGLAASSGGHLSGLWTLSAAFYQAQAAGLLQPDVYAKRVSSRLLAQLRLGLSGQHEVSQRLAQDVLFFCAHASVPDDAHAAPRLQAVREAYELDAGAAFDYQAVRLGRFDPALIAQARKRVAGAKEAWSAVAGGEAHRMTGLAEQFALVGDSLKRLYPSGEVLADALQGAVSQTLASGQTPPAALAMEVATSVIYLDASLEDGEFDHPLVAPRVQRMAQRIVRVGEGHDAQPLEPWMEELYRRVSDRQTMGSVVQELRASLSEAEKQIDQYFRNPAQREVLIPVPSQLQAMRGVFSVLDMQQASQAVLRMCEDVDALASTEVDAQHAVEAGTFNRLADNLGALSFMIDMLSVQPQMAKSLFRFDPQTGNLAAVMGRRKRSLSVFGGLDELEPSAIAPLVHQAQTLALAAVQPEVPHEALQQGLARLSQQALLADQRALAEAMASAQAALNRATDDTQRQAARADLAQAVAGLAEPEHREQAVQQPVRATPEPQPEVQGSTGLEDDAEMREIFIDEAREVLQGAREALARLGERPDDLGDLTMLRRAFHTLKGSSRMVGLKDFGEAAWSCEQLYNTRLAENSRLDGELGDFTAAALRDLDEWVEAIAAGRQHAHASQGLSARADALRLGVQPPVVAMPAEAADAAAARASAALLERVPRLPSAADLEFELDLGIDLSERAPSVTAAEPLLERVALDLEPVPEERIEAFHLDLALDGPAEKPTTDADTANDLGMAWPQAIGGVTKPMHLDLSDEVAPRSEQSVEDEKLKIVGDLRIGIPLFNIYLNEADELSRRLCTELSEWALESAHRPVDESTAALAHSLAGSSATVGYVELSGLARSLEHALMRSITIGRATPGEPQLFNDAAEEIRHLLHQFAAGFLKRVSAPLMKRLEQHELEVAALTPPAGLDEAPDVPVYAAADAPEQALAAAWIEPAAAAAPASVAEAAPQAEPAPQEAEPVVDLAPLPSVSEELGQAALTPFSELARSAMHKPAARHDALDDEDDIDAVDAIDDELFPIFREEGEELLPQLQSRMRDWVRRPAELSAAAACMRTLHTFKGGARLAGAMRLGEMAHRLETAIEHLLARDPASAADVEALLARVDAISGRFDLLGRPSQAVASAVVEAAQPPAADCAEPQARRTMPRGLPGNPDRESEAAAQPEAPLVPSPPPVGTPGAAVADIDWARFKAGAGVLVPVADRPATSTAAVRVRAPLLDRLVNQAGEVEHHALAHRVRCRPDQGLAGRPDAKTSSAAPATARPGAAGRDRRSPRAWRRPRPRRRPSTRWRWTASRASRNSRA